MYRSIYNNEEKIEKINKWIELRKNGMNAFEAALQLEVSDDSLRSWIKKFNLKHLTKDLGNKPNRRYKVSTTYR